MKKVLITGVAGFIGSHLLDFLLDETDWYISGVDNLSTGRMANIEQRLDHERFDFKEMSLFELHSLKEYDLVFHLAALPRIQPSFELVSEHIRENLMAAVHLIEIMIGEGHFPRLINSSSSAVYGTPETIPTSESERISCLSPYAFQKFETEQYLELLSTRYPLDYVNLRYFNPYGPRSFNPDNKFNAYSSVVGIFLYRAKNGQSLQVTGDGAQKRDFVHVRDLARANYLAAIHPEKLNTAFNIGHSSTMSIIELAKRISEDITFIDKREGEAEITYADVSKARKVLGWEPLSSLKSYLAESLQKNDSHA